MQIRVTCKIRENCKSFLTYNKECVHKESLLTRALVGIGNPTWPTIADNLAASFSIFFLGN